MIICNDENHPNNIKPDDISTFKSSDYIGEIGQSIFRRRFQDGTLDVEIITLTNDPDSTVNLWDVAIATLVPEDRTDPDGNMDGYSIILTPTEFLAFVNRMNETVVKLREVGVL